VQVEPIQWRLKQPREQRIGEVAIHLDDVGRKPDTTKPGLAPCRVVSISGEARILLDIGVDQHVDLSPAIVGVLGIPIALPDIVLQFRIGRRRKRRELLGPVSGARNIGGRPGGFSNPCREQRDETEAANFNPTGHS